MLIFHQEGRAFVKRLVLWKRLFLAAAIFCAAGIVASFVFRFFGWTYCVCFSLMGGTLAFAFFYSTHKKMNVMAIIVDNTIIHIKPAVISGQTVEAKEEEEKLRENFGVRISTFGILLGNKIIKWGGGDERLKAAEIGKDYISIDYGTRENTQNIRLLYSRPGEDELAEIIEKFRHETGIVPEIAV